MANTRFAWEDNIRKVVPYTPGEQPKKNNIIKLNTNENPYPPAPGVVDVIKNFDCDSLRKYPDPTVGNLVHAIAEVYDVKDEEVFVGVGSDDVLAMAFMTCFNSDKPILFPDITYSFYDVWAELLRIPYETQALDENFHIIPEDYMKENGGVIFPNPNAPTGVLMSLENIEKIIAANRDVVVIVDEAYIDFGGESARGLINKYDNLLVVQTFSKSRSMAGMRIGFILGNEKIIKYINDVKYSFNSYTMNRVAIESGVASVTDTGYFNECVNKVIKTREWTKERLKERGFIFEDSKSNFIFAKSDKISGEKLFEELKKRDIYVRHFSKPERINDYLRISIGTDAEMKKFVETLDCILENN
ncbi:MAG: histidinol-phosphate transaminase [Lachnospiraceae bacterium]|nr:histidinol-phosphate transaminase [Lachnospiraceae bacterium]